jgi:hypothetical protein
MLVRGVAGNATGFIVDALAVVGVGVSMAAAGTTDKTFRMSVTLASLCIRRLATFSYWRLIAPLRAMLQFDII